MGAGEVALVKIISEDPFPFELLRKLNRASPFLNRASEFGPLLHPWTAKSFLCTPLQPAVFAVEGWHCWYVGRTSMMAVLWSHCHSTFLLGENCCCSDNGYSTSPLCSASWADCFPISWWHSSDISGQRKWISTGVSQAKTGILAPLTSLWLCQVT